MPTMRTFASPELADLVQRARSIPRKRANLNVHPELDDPIQRMFNCFQPGTYVRPPITRRAAGELFVLLSGRLDILTSGTRGRSRAARSWRPAAPRPSRSPAAPPTPSWPLSGRRRDGGRAGAFRPLTGKDLPPGPR